MYDFYYNKMVKGLPCELDLGFSDTDSFLFKVNNASLFWKHIRNSMDFSNYDPSHDKFSSKNKAKLGFFKDELAGENKCVKFVGLRSKCYAIKLKNKRTDKILEKKTCKGLARVAIKNRLRFKHYEECLKYGVPKRYDFSTIRSFKQNVFTIHQKKIALSSFDSKRWIYDCGIHSSPYGSKVISKFFGKCPKC